MAKRMRPKTPTRILEARGSWLAKVRGDEPEATGRPVCPAWLDLEAKRFWRRIVPTLSVVGVGKIDNSVLGRYCQLWAWWMECKEFIAKCGTTITQKDENGQFVIKEYPQVGRAARLSDQLLKIEQQYGMTPAARASLAVAPPKKEEHADDGSARSAFLRVIGS